MTQIVYAFMVLRLGVSSVYLSPDATCRNTAPELFQATSAFVSLSIAAWTLLIFGYLLPFGIVAALLTWNGYNPESAMESTSPTFPGVLPSAYTNSGAPPGVIDRVQTVILEEFPDHYPKECCVSVLVCATFDLFAGIGSSACGWTNATLEVTVLRLSLVFH